MSVNTITYTDKQQLNANTSVAAINKVQATDMNEIKSVVNANANLIGDLTNLTTSEKTTIVGSINELDTIGDTIIFSKPGYENVQTNTNTTMGYSTKDATNSIIDFCNYDDSTKKYTITQTGLYLIMLNNQWAENSGAGIRYQEIYYNTRRYAMQTATATAGQKISLSSSCVLALNANDEFIVRVYQTSGVADAVEFGSRMYIVKLK